MGNSVVGDVSRELGGWDDFGTAGGALLDVQEGNERVVLPAVGKRSGSGGWSSISFCEDYFRWVVDAVNLPAALLPRRKSTGTLGWF